MKKILKILIGLAAIILAGNNKKKNTRSIQKNAKSIQNIKTFNELAKKYKDIKNGAYSGNKQLVFFKDLTEEEAVKEIIKFKTTPGNYFNNIFINENFEAYWFWEPKNISFGNDKPKGKLYMTFILINNQIKDKPLENYTPFINPSLGNPSFDDYNPNDYNINSEFFYGNLKKEIDSSFYKEANEKATLIYCFMRSQGNSHELSWNEAYEYLKRQRGGNFKLSKKAAVAMIIDGFVNNQEKYPGCGKYLGDLLKEGDIEFNSKTKESNTRITESGLVITDLIVGEGDEATPGQTVTVNYTGTLENGKQFDTSIGRAPYSFPLGAGRVIEGWDEGVEGMKVGGKRKLIIPPELGYGNKGSGNVIPPNATLIFEVELLKVN